MTGLLAWTSPLLLFCPQLVAHRGAVLFGYSSYFLSAVLLVSLAIILQCLFSRQGSVQQSPLLLSATAFGVLSGAMKSLGLVRWLFLMPYLADRYMISGQSSETQETISLIYDAFNLYAGKIGEFMGVQLFTAVWVGLFSIVLWRSRQIPNWLCWFGMIVAIIWLSSLRFGMIVAIIWLSSLLEAFGIGLFESTIFIGTTLLNFWYLSLTFVLFKRFPRVPLGLLA